MKSLIFLAALGVVAAAAQKMDMEYDEVMKKYDPCIPDFVKSFATQARSLTDEQANEMNTCMAMASGMMDDTGLMQFDRICQSLHIHLPDIAEQLCTYVQDCDRDVLPENVPKVGYVSRCVAAKLMTSCVKGIQMPA